MSATLSNRKLSVEEQKTEKIGSRFVTKQGLTRKLLNLKHSTGSAQENGLSKLVFNLTAQKPNSDFPLFQPALL